MPRTPTAGDARRWPAARAVPHDPVAVVTVLWAAVLVAMVVTYTRVAPERLYHVSIGGLRGGWSRAVVQINFPIALVAIGATAVSVDRLSRGWRVWAAVSVALCAVTAWPGVVDDADLDVRWVNVVPATGVAMAVVTGVAAFRSGRPTIGRLPLDGWRVAVAGGAALVSVPWIAADLGVYLPGRLFIMERALAGDRVGEVAVHLGHHHGFDGALVLVTALVLSRARVSGGYLAPVTRGYVALLLGYGAVNMVQDTWNEQIVKRGWSDWWMPSAVHPGVTPIWGVVLAVAAGGYAAATWEARRCPDR